MKSGSRLCVLIYDRMGHSEVGLPISCVEMEENSEYYSENLLLNRIITIFRGHKYLQ